MVNPACGAALGDGGGEAVGQQGSTPARPALWQPTGPRVSVLCASQACDAPQQHFKHEVTAESKQVREAVHEGS